MQYGHLQAAARVEASSCMLMLAAQTVPLVQAAVALLRYVPASAPDEGAAGSDDDDPGWLLPAALWYLAEAAAWDEAVEALQQAQAAEVPPPCHACLIAA